MSIRFLKLLVFLMGILIIIGLIILCVGIYYKANNLSSKTSTHKNLIIQQLPQINMKNYYINDDRLIIDYKNNEKSIIYIYNLKNGKLIKKIEILK